MHSHVYSMSIYRGQPLVLQNVKYVVSLFCCDSDKGTETWFLD